MADDISLVVGVDYSEMTGLVKTTGQTKRALNLMAKEFANSGSQKNYMAGINKLVAAQRNLDKSARLSRSEIMKLGNQMKQEAQFASALAKSTDGLGQAYGFAGKRANRAGVLAQQAGYQFGDFAVQVQSGTNVMVAAGQQATQLVGTFSMLAKTTKGIMAFSALGVIIPVLTGIGAAFMRTKGAADEAAKATEAFESALSSARSEVKGMSDDLRLLQSGFKNTFELTLSDAVDVAKSKLSEAIIELERLNNARAAASFGAGLGGGGMFTGLLTGGLSDEVDAAREAVRLATVELATAQELSRQEEQRARNASVVIQLSEVRQTLQREERERQGEINALEREVSEYAKNHNWEKTQLQRTTQQLLDDAIKVHNQEKAIREELGDAAVNALKLAGVDIASGVDAAAKAAARLAGDLGVSLGLANAMINARSNIEARVSAAAELSSETGTSGFTPVTLSKQQIQDALDAAKPKKATGGGSKAEDPIVAFKKQLDLQQALIGKTEEQKKLISALGIDYQSKYSPAVVSALETQITLTGILTEADAKRKEALEEATRQQEALADFVANSMGDALMSIVDGTVTVKDAFKSMATDIIKELYRVLVVERMVQSIKGFLSPSSIPVPSANGNVFSKGSIQAYANGGVVGGPTYFPMAGGKTGLMGEAGPEAIMPLKRGANGKLGVQMEGGGGNTTVVQNFNFSANGDDSVKKIIAQAAPQIANMTKKSIMDDRRRGGQMKATFG